MGVKGNCKSKRNKDVDNDSECRSKPRLKSINLVKVSISPRSALRLLVEYLEN